MSDSADNLNHASEGKEDGDPPVVRDSRLEGFLRQASAIIASEKGLTNAAKARLEGLATRLHLPDELFQQGLGKLQDSNAPVGDLTAYESGFLKYLTKEFSRLPTGSVLTISMEETAIAIAKDKFQIPAHRAEQLVDFQTRESGLGRLSREDAKVYGRQTILDQIGDQLTLDQATQKRILKLARQWGIKSVDANELMLQQLASNRREQSATPKRRSGMNLLLAVLLMGSISTAGFWWYLQNQKKMESKSETASLGDTEKDSPSLTVVNPATAESTSSIAMSFPELADGLSSGDLAIRTSAIEDLAEQVLKQSLDAKHRSAFAMFYVDELDERAACQFEDRLVALMDERSLLKQANLSSPYRLLAFAQRVDEVAEGLPDDRTHAKQRSVRLRSALAQQIGIESDALRDRERQQEIESVIANLQWNNLIRSSWSTPRRSAVLVEPLMTVTEGRLDEETFMLLLNRTARTIIQADASVWSDMKVGLKRAMESSDEIQTVEWIEVYFDKLTESSAFRDFATPVLLKLVGDEDSMNANTSNRLRKFQSNYRNRLLRPALLRHAKIDAIVIRLQQQLSVEGSGDSLSPDLIYQVAAASNLCLEMVELADAGRAGDETAFGEIDIQLQRAQQRLREFIFIDDPEASGANVLPSSGFDTTSRDRSIANLSDLSESNRGLRRAAIAELAKLTDKFDSIPQSQAIVVAKYLLSPIERSEWLDVQRAVPKLARWRKVVLAVSDQLPDSESPLDQTLTMLNLLTGERFEVSSSGAWRQDLGWRVFIAAKELFSRRSREVDPSSSGSDWVRLRKYFELALYRRATLLGADLKDVDREPWLLAVACVEAKDNTKRTQRAIQLIQDSTANEVSQIAMVSRLLLESSQRRNAESNASSSAASQLFETELALLEHWDQIRKAQLEGMLDVE